MVAERLAETVMLDRVILIAAAISPRYDMAGVLARTRSGLTNFYSPHDWLILGAGTSVFGTIDRRRGSSAGRVGFRDADDRLTQADRLTQIGWRREWRNLGHAGGHIGWLSAAWARAVLAPQIDASLRPSSL